ncbi:MAG TPA: UDP-N-acetylmuramoyl-L-alanyl-D-glutamate--2,6-diaminopimelate ligase [Aggregatilineales bacterium]|nr:UDP-N-acetylmuramoyl-L-alanyl-D-glutamate--2,6-diaminopimelate ligase [Anaerolineales bacterium]HRE47866.1 UDP-N-acetylmuramoyl-L-alanyl-D-glutamate--2,6-diaminopimelate ligase [Aggregatilineales bacterium]
MIHLQTLLARVPGVIDIPTENPRITAPITEDSRAVQAGGVFLARRGTQVDSHAFIGTAAAAGAAAIIGEQPRTALGTLPTPYVQVANSATALGYLAAAYEGFPSDRLTVIGVTGTDGKTTTTNLIYHILKAAGIRVGMISTISAVIGDEDIPTGLHVTTPTAPEVHSYLRRMVEAGLTHAILETTSHGLAQGRVNGVSFDIAVLTNVTHEHLDYHGTFEAYRAAKGLLFKNVSESSAKAGIMKALVINGDDPNRAYFEAFPVGRRVIYSLNDVQDLSFFPDRTTFTLNIKDSAQDHTIRVPMQTALIGEFNVQNILAAANVGAMLGIAPATIQRGITSLPPISGRMERLDEGQDFLALVDFAHTPNALLRALTAARRMTSGQVIAVFGSAGLRDVEKRRMMAEIGVEHADLCILTAEDPRTESLDEILAMMAAGALSKGGKEGHTFYRVPDRGAALAFACALANPGDVVIACGKGHEQSMCFGTVEYAWDDREALRAALRGHPLRTLPTRDAKGAW